MKKEYKVIAFSRYSLSDINHFEEKVSDYLKDGWDLVGGVSISRDNDGFYTFSQAVVKTEE